MMMNQPHIYQIHIEGMISDSWSEWLDGLVIESPSNDETVIRGLLFDQAALLGVLTKIHALNLAIISVEKLPLKKTPVGTKNFDV
jgi:hypothetical protein